MMETRAETGVRYDEMGRRIRPGGRHFKTMEEKERERCQAEMDEDFAPRKEWWQRSIDSGMGGRSRDPGELRKSMSSYARQFQSDILKMRSKRMEESKKKGVA